MKDYLVTLRIKTGLVEEGAVSPPQAWDWASLLDLAPDESVEVVKVSVYPAGQSGVRRYLTPHLPTRAG